MASFAVRIIMFMSVIALLVLLPLQAHGATVAFTYCNTVDALNLPVENVEVSLGDNGIPLNFTIELGRDVFLLGNNISSSGEALLSINIQRARDHNLSPYYVYYTLSHVIVVNTPKAFQNIYDSSENDVTMEITLELLGTQLMCIRFPFSF